MIKYLLLILFLGVQGANKLSKLEILFPQALSESTRERRT